MAENQLATASPGQTVISPVQRLAFTGAMGVTLSRSLDSGAGAVAASVRLDTLTRSLSRFRLTPASEMALVDGDGRIVLSVGSSDAGEVSVPVAQGRSRVLAAMTPLFERLRGQPDALTRAPVLERFRSGGTVWFGSVVGIPSALHGGASYLLVAVPERELLAGARLALRESLLATLAVVFLSVPLVVLVSHRLSAALRQLARQAAAIRAFEFEGGTPVRSMLREVDDLATTFEGMRETIQTFLQSSAALGAEPDVERLLQRLLDDAIASSGASGGELHRAEAITPELMQPSADPCTLHLPLRSRDAYIGIRPAFDGRYASEGRDVQFELVAVDAEGKAIALPQADYKIERILYSYQWYQQDGRWRWQSIVSDRLVTADQVSIKADGPAQVARRLGWGSYKITVSDRQTNSASSMSFYVGWYGGNGSEEAAPDTLKVASDKQKYLAGETARLRIEAPFAGEALVAVATDRIVATYTAKVTPEGNTIDIPVKPEWGAGAYALVTAWRSCARNNVSSGRFDQSAGSRGATRSPSSTCARASSLRSARAAFVARRRDIAVLKVMR